MARAERYTNLKVTPVYYTDFLNDFQKNPNSGALASLTNDEAVKNSIKNLILTNQGERFYQPLIGSQIRAMLFEPFSVTTKNTIEQLIREAINNYEPRAQLHDVRVDDDIDRNGVYVTIVFSIINIPTPVNLNLFLSRVR